MPLPETVGACRAGEFPSLAARKDQLKTATGDARAPLGTIRIVLLEQPPTLIEEVDLNLLTLWSGVPPGWASGEYLRRKFPPYRQCLAQITRCYRLSKIPLGLGTGLQVKVASSHYLELKRAWNLHILPIFDRKECPVLRNNLHIRPSRNLAPQKPGS